MDTVVPAAQVPETEQHTSQVFVDASGRRARRMTRCGYLLGLGCVGYIGMVAMGLSGTRVAALPGVPTSAENEIIAGLSGEGGGVGLNLTRVPVAAQPALTTPERVTEGHSAAVHSATPRAATHTAALTARGVQVLAEGATTADPTESKSQQKAEEKAAKKADSKHGKQSSGDKSAYYKSAQ